MANTVPPLPSPDESATPDGQTPAGARDPHRKIVWPDPEPPPDLSGRAGNSVAWLCVGGISLFFFSFILPWFPSNSIPSNESGAADWTGWAVMLIYPLNVGWQQDTNLLFVVWGLGGYLLEGFNPLHLRRLVGIPVEARYHQLPTVAARRSPARYPLHSHFAVVSAENTIRRIYAWLLFCIGGDTARLDGPGLAQGPDG